jgi:chromosome segregation ATPase
MAGTHCNVAKTKNATNPTAENPPTQRPTMFSQTSNKLTTKLAFTIVSFTFALILITNIASTAAAAAPKKKKTPNYASAIAKLKAQIAEAQSELNSVNQKLSPAKGKESEAKSRVQSIVSAMQGAQSSLRNAHDTLEEIEKHILAVEDEAGEFAKSQKALDDVRQKLHAAQERILKSPDYLAKKQDAMDSPNRADLLADLRKKSLEDDAEYEDQIRVVAAGAFQKE